MSTRRKALFDRDARKRPVNLTLNEDLVAQAKSIADNLSAVVETLLAEYVAREQAERMAKSEAVAATMASWNEFADEHGSFADEHSTL
jgi:antitoxin CcdA